MHNKRNKVLIVDDDNSIRTTMAGILRKEGYEVVTLDNGYEAIDKVKENSFDIALLDIKMPGINGVETFKEIKKISSETVVIMMTAYAVEDLIKEALTEGAYTVLNKPLEMEKILNTIEEIKDKDFILVVDDDLNVRVSLSNILEQEGFRVISVGSGEEAVRITTRKPVDLMLLDVKMPGMDGVETLIKIEKEIPKHQQPATIMMSAYHTEETVEKAYSHGAKRFFFKPLDINALKKDIEELLAGDKTSGTEAPKILIVDDEYSTCEMLANHLENAGYRVETASDGKEALSIIEQDHHKAVLLDVMLPDINGFDLYKRIKKIKPNVGIIVMTAYAEDKMVKKAIREGSFTYMFKPFDMSKLLGMIKNIIKEKNETETEH